MEELTDLSPMPFGMHAGKPMQDVPVKYLHWLWHQTKNDDLSRRNQGVINYIKKNLSALRLENKDLIWA